MVCLDHWGYPIERIRGRWLRNILRILMYTRRIRRGYWDGYCVVNTKAPRPKTDFGRMAGGNQEERPVC